MSIYEAIHSLLLFDITGSLAAVDDIKVDLSLF